MIKKIVTPLLTVIMILNFLCLPFGVFAASIFVDEIANASKMEDSSNIRFPVRNPDDSNHTGPVYNDITTACLTNEAQGDGYVVYKATDITYALVKSYKPTSNEVSLKFYCSSSKDGSWTELKANTVETDNGFMNWVGYQHTITGFSSGTVYFKIVIPFSGDKELNNQLILGNVELGNGTPPTSTATKSPSPTASATNKAVPASVIFDEFKDGSMMDSSDNIKLLALTAEQATTFPEDTTRARRNDSDDSKEGSVIYKVNGLTSATVKCYQSPTVTVHPALYASADNTNWTKLEASSTQGESSGGWNSFETKGTGIPENTSYIKIVIPPTGAEFNSIQIGWVKLVSGDETTIGDDTIGKTTYGIMGNPDFSKAVKFLYGYGAIDESVVTTEKLNEPVSRAEFSLMLATLLGFDMTYVPQSPISDVPTGGAEASSIAILTEMGYMKAFDDGTFRPNEGLLPDDIALALYRALGYPDDLNDNTVPMYVIGQLGVTRNIVFKNNVPVTREQAAQLLFKMLETKPANIYYKGRLRTQKNDNMFVKLGISKRSGQISGTRFGHISGRGKLEDNEITVDTIIYQVNDYDIHGLLGENITFYIKGEDTPTIISYELTNNADETLRIPADRVLTDDTSFSLSNFVYEDDNGNIEKVPMNIRYLVKNGARKLVCKLDDFKLKNGFLKLIDSDDDGIYETAVTEEYKHYFVESIRESVKHIYSKYDKDGLNLDDKEYDNLTILKDGIPVEFKDIAEKNVLSVAISEDKEYAKVVVTTESVSGDVEEIINNENKVIINSKEYEVSSTYKELLKQGASGVIPFKIDMSGVFYLDCEGEIAGIEAIEIVERYGFMIKAALSQTLDANMQVKLLTEEGTVVDLDCRNMFTINDAGNRQKYSGQEALDLLNAKSMTEGLIKYELDANSLIRCIYLPATSPSGQNFSLGHKNTVAFFNGYDIIDEQYSIQNAKIFVVPAVREDYHKYSNKYKFVSGVRSSIGRKYSIELFDVDSFNYAKALVVYKSATEGANQNISGNALALVTKLTSVIDEQTGNVVTKISLYQRGVETGYLMSDSLRVEAMPDGNSDPKGLTVGDIVQFGLNSDNEISRMTVYYKADAGTFYTGLSYVKGYGENLQTYEYLYICGEVENLHNSHLLINNGTSRKMMTVEKASVMIYNKDRNQISIGKATDIANGDVVVARASYTVANEIFVIR